MMPISKLNSVDYLLKHAQHEYFTENDNEKGYFAGRLSKWQHLEGKEVDEKNFTRLVGYGKEFQGVEIDPSPPKDWSILINRVSPEEREQLAQVWKAAITEVCKAVEQNTYYRETKDGKTEYKLAKGICMAVFDHHTARPVNGQIDPQEHSHIVIFPKVLGQDGKFHSHTLLELKYEKNGHETLRYFDAVMQYHLAKGLNALGYTVSPDKKGNFQIDGISDEMRKNFSKRTNQVEEITGKDASYAEKKKTSLQQRVKKEDNDLSNLRQDWQEKMDKLGLTADKLAQMKTGHQQDKSIIFHQILGKEKAILSNKRLKTLSFQQATFSGKTQQEVFNEFKQSRKIANLGSSHCFNLASPGTKQAHASFVKQKVQARKATTSKIRTPSSSMIAATGTGGSVGTNLETKIEIQKYEASARYYQRVVEIMTRPRTTFKEMSEQTDQLNKALAEYYSMIEQLNNALFRIALSKQELEL